MSYIILNGQNSTSITGLLIQSLPPISKPLIRTQIDEIDGRDGDIVTKLGYSAYDKTVIVGLHGNFDINEIIAFFDSEGVVTFSNEPDKYYKYEITAQIDFERLIRFRTASVTFHCQPFKYALNEIPLSFSPSNLLLLTDNTITKNGLTLTASANGITISGTATAATEIYLPIPTVTLAAGNYILNAYASGTNPSACAMRLINSSPSAANSFGGTYVTLQNNSTVSIEAELTATKTYNYLYFYITAQTMDFTLNISVENQADSITVTNSGNTASKPKYTIYGYGTLNISVNGYQALLIELGDEEYITIDVDTLNAEKDGVFKNRLVSGDYENMSLNAGNNVITWSGEITEITVENYSRWI